MKRNIGSILEWSESNIRNRSFNFAHAYAEPGYTDPENGAVVFGDWNPLCGFSDATKEQQKRDPMTRLARVLEALGCELEWGDEWATCGDCGKAVRTQPDSYSWTSHFRIVNECELVCLDCLGKDKEGYLESIEDDANKACPPEWNPAELGYTKHNGQWETGFHPGQNDSPKEVLKAMHNLGLRHVVFRIAGNGQFDVRWEAYFKAEESEPQVA